MQAQNERSPASARSGAFVVVLWLYALGSLAMLALLARSFADPGASGAGERAVFAAGCVLNAAIAVGGWRRAVWVRALAITLHAVVTAIASVGLASFALERPVFEGGAVELSAKAAVHVLALWLWCSRWMGRQLARG
jgi:hypothetical protein